MCFRERDGIVFVYDALMTTVAKTMLTVAAVAEWKKPSPGSSQLVFVPLVLSFRCYSLERLHPLVAVCSSGMSLTRSRSCIFINAGVVKKFPPLITSKPDFTPTRHSR